VHGEKHNMMRLKSKLLSLNTDKPTKVKVYSPANCEELKIPFKTVKTAKVVGKLAQIPPPQDPERDEPQVITGVLVQNDFKMTLMAPEDLREYAGLTTTTITCKQRLTLSAAGIDLIRWALEGTFGAIEELDLDSKSKQANGSAATTTNGHGGDSQDYEPADYEIARAPDPQRAAFLIMGCVTVRCQNGGEVSIEWEGNVLNDGIADAVLAVLFTVESSPAAVKRKSPPPHSTQHATPRHNTPHNPNAHTGSSTKHTHTHPNPHANITPRERFTRLCMFLEAQFGPTITPLLQPRPNPHPSTLPPTDHSTIKPEPRTSTPDSSAHDLAELEAEEELARLHAIGIPVPGVEIRVDKHVARVWLETLEVECESGVLRDRVRAVVERAVETVAPLWGGKVVGV